MAMTSGSSSSCVRAGHCGSMWHRFIRCFTGWKNAVGSAGAGSRRPDNAGAVITGSLPRAKRSWRRNAKAGASSWKRSAASPGSTIPEFKETIRERLADLNLSPAREAEIVEELSQHLEDQYEQAMSRGASEEEAQQAVLTELDENDLLVPGLKRVERPVTVEPLVMGREGKTNMMADLWQDLRYAARMLARTPAFTTIAVLALALGIGANTAIFSVVNKVLLQPLPFKNPGELVIIWENATHLGFPKNTPSPANFLDWRDQSTLFTGMAAMAPKDFNLTGVGEPERLDGRRVSANLFDLLGVQPRLGRRFLPEEDKPGTHVVILSYGLWQRRFGSDPRIVGQSLNLNGESYSVVGVMPPAISVSSRGNWKDQLWIPIAFPAEESQS